MKLEPQPEHRWLQRLVGDWSFEHRAEMAPDQPAQIFRGRERVRMIGDVWVIGEGEGEMPGGGSAQTMITLGFDPAQQRFRGSWIGSMMTTLWIYDGTLEGDVLTLDSEGPDFTQPGRIARYRDIVEVVGADERLFRSQTLADAGWRTFMTGIYRRER